MYHIHKDKRAFRSAELLYEGLLACMKEKPYEQITVTDIQRASGVARTTFYRCFDNISDILYWKCDMCFIEVLGSYHPTHFDELDLAHHFFAYWVAHDDILELLIKINRQDIIYSCHLNRARILSQRYGDIPGLTPEQAPYFMAIRTGFLISVLTVWLANGRKESAEELVHILEEQVAMLGDSR